MATATDNDNLRYPLIFMLLTTVFLAYAAAKALIQNRRRSRIGAQGPPSPPALPIIGHLHLTGKALPISFQALAKKYGPLMQIKLGFSTCVVASSAAVAGEIFKTQDLNFASRPEFGSSENFIYRGSRFTTAPYGEYWRFMKKLSMTRLLSVPQLRLFADVVDDEKVRMVRSVARCAADGSLCDLHGVLIRMSNNVICRMAMTMRCSDSDGDAEEVRRLVETIVGLGGRLAFGDILGPLRFLYLSGTGKKLAGALMEYDRLVEMIIKEHEEKALKNDVGERKDILDILLETYNDPDAEIKLSKKDIGSFGLGFSKMRHLGQNVSF